MKYLTGLFLSIFFSVLALTGGAVHAQFDPLDQTCQNAVNSSDAQPICEASTDPGDPITGDNGLVEDAANILAFAAAVIAVIVVTVAGITMMTSDGDAGKVAASRNAIIYTVIGLLVIIVARSIVVFVMVKVAT